MDNFTIIYKFLNNKIHFIYFFLEKNAIFCYKIIFEEKSEN